MIGARLVASCCVTMFVLPLISLGQSRPEAGSAGGGARFAPTVTVHQLRIPDKAVDAYNKGIKRFAAQDWPGSLAEFQRAIAAYKDFYEAYYEAGLADLELKICVDAEAAFRKSIELSEGRFAPALFGLGLTLGNGKQFDDALAFTRAGLLLEPMNPRGHFTLAWILYRAGRVAESEQSAKQAVLYSPDFAMGHLLLAQIHQRQNNLAAVVEELDAYLRIEPNSSRSAGVKAARDQAAQEQAARQVAQSLGESVVTAADGRVFK
jgi:tetratricopeptide (TPR) repeat protein